MVDIQGLPEKIKKKPHWRTTLRPSTYAQRIDNAKTAFSLIREASVTLRGWDVPHISEQMDEQIREQEYVASGADFCGYTEYWRFYYSGQFVHLQAVREQADEDWRAELKRHAEHCIKTVSKDRLAEAPGFMNILNMVYNFTEFFEFATRMVEKGIYAEGLEITIQLVNAEGFSLIAEYPKRWWGFYPSTSDNILKVWTLQPEELIASSREIALAGATYFLERFGWDKVPVDILKDDQQKLLSGRF